MFISDSLDCNGPIFPLLLFCERMALACFFGVLRMVVELFDSHISCIGEQFCLGLEMKLTLFE